MADKIGEIKQREIDLLGLSLPAGTPIYIGPQNIKHMKQRHPADYAKYGQQVNDIIDSPTYVSLHPSDGSIQYIKEFHESGTDNRVLVAVRAVPNGDLFTRTLFVMSEDKWVNYNAKGYILVYDPPASLTPPEVVQNGTDVLKGANKP